MRAPRFVASSLVLAASIAGCSVEPGTSGESGGAASVIDASKADNYRSPIGREFDLTGAITIDLSAAEDASQQAAQALASPLLDSVATALDKELQRVWPENRRTSEPNLTVMLRTASSGIGEVRGGEETGVWSVNFYAEMGAPSDFLSRYPVRTEDGRSYIDVTASVQGADQTIALEITESEQNEDSYPDYTAMMEDGLDVAFHVGGDYNDPRDDVSHARVVYKDLIDQGFQSPVDDFDALALDSGPLTMPILAPDGHSTEVRVRIYHPEMVPDERLQELVDAYKQSAATADVIIYSGHAGTDPGYSGVVVHYNPRVALTANEFATIDLPTKYQIFVFNGCETYTAYADQLYRNPNKTPSNLDVVTTVNYSWTGTQDEQFLRGLWATHNRGFYPQSWDALLHRLEDYRGVRANTIYGVHGTYDNAKISPTASVDEIGLQCESDAYCGGVDNLCVTMESGSRVCGAACTADSGCPEGTRCRGVEGHSLPGTLRQCLPSD